MRKRIALIILFSFFCLTISIFTSPNAYGKRDPFRDLLVQKETTNKSGVSGTPGFSIEDVVLAGISKAKEKFTAIINSPQGFPFFIKKGDKFSDGYVYSINESQVIFLQTKRNNIPLRKPIKVIKEL